MKPTRNLRNWCHVSCALWIPETSFGNPLKLEPITNINKISTSRWQLTCSLCKIKTGCCVQCSDKKCMVAFHITCAFKHNLLIEQNIIEDRVESKCYCLEHTKIKRENMSNIDESKTNVASDSEVLNKNIDSVRDDNEDYTGDDGVNFNIYIQFSSIRKHV